MWRWAVLWQATTLLLAGATFDLRFLSRHQILPDPKANCVDFTSITHRNGQAIHAGFPHKTTIRITNPTAAVYPTFPLLKPNEIMARRIDRLLPNADDIVKEHAKLVQDINGLRQAVYVRPFVEDNRDYEESVFHEIIEVATTPRPTPKPTTPRAPIRPTRPHHSSIPIILLGGASENELVRTQPMKFSKPISLVGTSVSPLMKHPYPFVTQVSSQKPLKFCMNSMVYTTTPRPSLLQRLLNSILPRGR